LIMPINNNDLEPEHDGPERDLPESVDSSGNIKPDAMPRSLILSILVGAVLGVGFWLLLTELFVRYL
jgi:hypothetical protein